MAIKNILSFLLILASVAGFSQPGNTIMKPDTLITKRKKITELIITQPNSKFKEIIRLKNKKKHGIQETFGNNGQPIEKQNYSMGKLDGLTQRFYESGILYEQHTYQNDIESGAMSYFDKKGRKIFETNYSIILKDGKETSVKQGFEYRWENDVLISKSYFENGIEQGTREIFYNSGKPQVTAQIKDGIFDGEYLEYYENGQLKTKRMYVSKNTNPGEKPKTDPAGWQYEYGPDGKLTVQRFNDQNWNTISVSWFTDNKLQLFEISNCFYASYSPDGKLMSFKIMGQYNIPAIGYYFYKNKQLRKLKFQDPAALVTKNADFTDDGSFLNLYVDNAYESKKSSPSYPKELAKYVSREWQDSPLFLDAKKQGPYELLYANGKTFLKMEFQDNLLQGKFLVFEPVHGDTLVYKNFDKGVQRGDFIEKFAGKQIIKWGIAYPNGQIASIADFRPDGKPSGKKSFDQSGNLISNAEYYENGVLKSIRNDADKTSSEYDNNGILRYETVKVEGRSGWTVNRQFYPDSRQLKVEQFYFQEKQDSIQKGFYKNGQLQYQIPYKENHRNGNFIEYLENGQLKKTGQYQDDQMAGEWIIYNGPKTESSFYENGKLVVQPLTKHCGCLDTGMSQNQLRFAPTLENIVDLKTIKNYLPAFIKPIEDFNYDSLFMVNYQFSNGNDGGFSSFKLLMFKEFSFYIPADQQIKLILNPCKTNGYISTMEVTASYNFHNENDTHVNLRPGRIAMELVNSPLKSADTDYAYFRAMFDLVDIDFGYADQFKLNIAKAPNACFTKGIIHDFLKVEIRNGDPLLFNSRINRYGNLTIEESNHFFGIFVSEAAIAFEVAENGKSQSFNVKSNDLLAGGKFVSGSINIPCKKLGVDSFSIKDNPEKFIFSSQNLKKEWMKKGFTRISMNYDEKEEILVFNFFAE